MLRVLLFLTILMCSSAIMAQYKEYIIKGDSALVFGDVKFDTSNPARVQIQRGKQGDVYDASQVSEFVINSKTKYISREILFEGKNQHVFLEILRNGELQLLKLKKLNKFFISENNVAELLTEDNYKSIILAFLDDTNANQKEMEKVSFKENYLRYIFKVLNGEKKKSIKISRNEYGPLLTAYNSTLKSNHNPSIGEVKTSIHGMEIGAFLHLPINNSIKLSLNNEIKYGKSQYYNGYRSGALSEDFEVNLSYIKMNLIPTIEIGKSKLNPFIQLGPSFTYFLNKQSSIYKYLFATDGTSAFVEGASSKSDLNSISFGVYYGIGIKYFYSQNHHISLAFTGENSLTNNQVSISNTYLVLKLNL